MTGATHLAAGLIIGHLTGDYVTAVSCSILVDADHLLPIIKHGLLFKPQKIWHVMTDPGDIIADGKIEDNRNYFHSVFTLILLSGIVMLINFPVGLVFAIAYAAHLSFDMLDKSNVYPFYPIKSVNAKGRIGYCSKQEFIFAGVLYLIRIALILTSGRF
ncbi:MAG: metal-dependent hydrolase [candidate division SR1 bacterium]|nr:metal-dependent hydrolase [candidate division SR1 bacterium]